MLIREICVTDLQPLTTNPSLFVQAVASQYRVTRAIPRARNVIEGLALGLVVSISFRALLLLHASGNFSSIHSELDYLLTQQTPWVM